jgi:hypothetical protein
MVTNGSLGGTWLPASSDPQHSMVESVRIPQMVLSHAERWTKVPEGGIV